MAPFPITCCCDGCAMNAVVLDTCVKNEKLRGNTNAVGMCVQIAFIIAGSTHAVYYKTLKHALGIDAVCMDVFMDTIYYMYPVVKSMLDIINPRRACAARVTVLGSVCLCVCYSQSHFLGVCSSHKGYHLLNGQ